MNTDKVRSEATVVIERTYRARLEDVWDLWTTKEGFESWWGPQEFHVAVHELEARTGGALRYEMIASTPKMIATMKEMGQAPSHAVRATFSVVKPREHLVITNVIDFLPNVAAYENDIDVRFAVVGDSVRMSVTLHAMHSEEFSKMQKAGFTSQLTKLDQRFGWKG